MTVVRGVRRLEIRYPIVLTVGSRINLLIIISCFVLTSCSLAPKYSRPALPTASIYPIPSNSLSNHTSIAHIGWRDFFPDAYLQSLIAESLNNNRDLRIATSRVEEARYNIKIQGSALLPQVNAVAYGGKTLIPNKFSLNDQNSTTSFYSGMLGANWEIDFFGRLRNIRESARQDYLASKEARRAVAISLIANVARTYLIEREYDERINLAHHTIETRQESYRIVNRRYEVGSGSKLDAMQALALLEEAKESIQALEQARVENMNSLTFLIGHPIKITSGTLQFADSYLTYPLPAGFPSDLLVNRPDIMEAEHQLQGIHADIGAARAAFLPRVIIFGGGGTATTEFNTLFGGGSGTWSFLPALSLPLFTGGRNRANLNLTEARRNTAVASYERTIQNAFREVADALAGRKWLTGQIQSEQKRLAALEERTRLAQLRYVSGKSAYLEVLDAQRDLFSTEQTLVRLHRAFLNSAIDLYAAVGGGIPNEADLSKKGNKQPW
ncbi:efflux transporter outer membrane subunit [Zymomonas mobilis]|uniref:efflux transporter outer membrane subunit n=1 Tax=Zymomonas mobilis TaxID=542 RepID=UPI00116BAB0D|nr:efflux transporter outer membrane subunit [Zymomonas mobilis]MDX5949589.1 efflux transporter outer membrane subunit [Zymomonas mobilis subsp. pomaceae]GEB90026.1 outer membrane efflux protein [Zymomonas mobilis subsp. pomaceae]